MCGIVMKGGTGVRKLY